MRKLTRRNKINLIYSLLSAAAAAAAFLCVLISNLLLKAEERRLYDRPAYEPFTLESGTAVGAPLSLSTRVALFDAGETEGPQRYPLPDELTEAEASALVRTAFDRLFSDMLSAAGQNEELLAAVDASAREVRTGSTLRDYLTADGSRYSLWCAQAWMDLSSGDAFSLTMYLDSRTGQPLMESAVLYPQDAPLLGLADMAARLGLGYDLAALSMEPDEAGIQLTLPLDGDLSLIKTISADGSRFTIRVTQP